MSIKKINNEEKTEEDKAKIIQLINKLNNEEKTEEDKAKILQLINKLNKELMETTPELKSIRYIEPQSDNDKLIPESEHLEFAFEQQPNEAIVKKIVDDFVKKLNNMNTGNYYRVFDNSTNIDGLRRVEYQVKAVDSEHPALNSTHYIVSRNINRSLGESVSIYIDGFTIEKDNLANALRAYQATLSL